MVALTPMEAAQHALIGAVSSSIVYHGYVLVAFCAALIVPAREEYVWARGITS
jgi:hypothetical protein